MSSESFDLNWPVPDENAPVEWLGFSLTVDFYPPVKVTRKTGLEFTAELAEILEPQSVQLEDGEWNIEGGGICEGIHLRVQRRQIRVLVVPVAGRLEIYERRINTILAIFERKFEPKVALESAVDISGLVDLSQDADARAFLGGYVMLMHPSKLINFARPLEILGVRLYFPPSDDVDWGVNVRVESWGGRSPKDFP